MSAASPIECVVLDFDGTFTDVEHEAVPFLDAYRTALAELVGASIDEPWERAVEKVRRDPDAYGFEFAGRIVAPSHADPYILATSVATLVLDEAGLGSRVERAEALENIFRTAYAESDTKFRDDAREVVEAVLDHGAPVFVVSNSHTKPVTEKLARLTPRGAEALQVRGNARKFDLVEPEVADDRFTRVPESLRVEGLSRPVYLRRGRYFDALKRIWDETDTTPAFTLVCGDIFELDLALPAALGASIHLVARERTPAYEHDAVAALGGTSSVELRSVLTRLRDG